MKRKHINIDIRAIPHKKHRYETVGDYWTGKNGKEQIRVSQMSDSRYELGVILHELIEDFLCQHRGIKEKDIMKFDVKYEKERTQGLHKPDDEPGHDKNAPYHKEHVFAEKIEMLFMHELGCDWDKYSDEVESL